MTPPTPAYDYTEDATVEQPAIALFGELGWDTGNLYHEWASVKSSEERETEHEIILVKRLRAALQKLNPTLPASALDQAIEELTRDRSRMVPVNANDEVYKRLMDGVKVSVTDQRGPLCRLNRGQVRELLEKRSWDVLCWGAGRRGDLCFVLSR